jgi:phosphatidylserine decarboxylase
LVIQQANSTAILLRQIAGALARRIRWYVKEAQPVQQGAQFGFIKFGSRVDIFLPLDAQIQTKLGDTTRGGETILALLPE